MGIISGFVKYKAVKNGVKVIRNILRKKKETTAPKKVRATTKKRATN